MSFSTGLILATGTSLIYSIVQLIDLSQCDQCEGNEKVSSVCQQVFYHYNNKHAYYSYIGNPMLADKEITVYSNLEISSKPTFMCENKELLFTLYVTIAAISCLILGSVMFFKCCKLAKPVRYYKITIKPKNFHREKTLDQTDKKYQIEKDGSSSPLALILHPDEQESESSIVDPISSSIASLSSASSQPTPYEIEWEKRKTFVIKNREREDQLQPGKKKIF